jgi:hypothetical protein
MHTPDVHPFRITYSPMRAACAATLTFFMLHSFVRVFLTEGKPFESAMMNLVLVSTLLCMLMLVRLVRGSNSVVDLTLMSMFGMILGSCLAAFAITHVTTFFLNTVLLQAVFMLISMRMGITRVHGGMRVYLAMLAITCAAAVITVL